MQNVISNLKLVAVMALTVVMIAVTSCGGGGGSTFTPDPGNNNNGAPAPGTTDVNGQIVEGLGGRAASAVGDGLAGIIVKLISTATGNLVGNDVTDSLGKYEFKGVPSGKGYLVKVEFTSTQDLNGDGRLDEIELYFPVDLADQAITDLLQQIGVTDSDNDGQLDAIEVEFRLTDDQGHNDSSHRQHRRRGGETRVDGNGDGQFDDSESFDDIDSDGIADTSFSGGRIDDSQSGLRELEVKGFIAAINRSSITVGDTSFALTGSTTWRIDDNRNADPAEFTVGTFVEVEGFSDGNGGWIATKVKTEDDFTAGSGGTTGGTGGGGTIIVSDEIEVRGFIEAISAGSITVAGQTFVLTGSTTWRIGDDRNADPSQFKVGMFVELEADLAGDQWNTRKVKLEDSASSGGSDDDSNDDSSDDDSSSGSDDDDDDNSGSDDDDDDDDDDDSDDDDSDDDDDDDDSDDDDDDESDDD